MDLSSDVSWCRDVRYYVDDFGYLWQGPLPGGEGFRYQRFEGLYEGPLAGARAGLLCWVWRCYDTQSDWEEIDAVRAIKMLALFKQEAGT